MIFASRIPPFSISDSTTNQTGNLVKKEKRLEYYNALDKAHTTGDYTDFVKLVNELEIEMLNKYLELL